VTYLDQEFGVIVQLMLGPRLQSASLRQFSRRELRTPVSVLLHGRLIKGLTQNLGAGGVGAAIPTSIGLDERVIVCIENFGLTLLASVRHRDGFLHGFEFLPLSGKQRDALRKLCDETCLTSHAKDISAANHS
jgi:hypothetical protein